MTGIKYIMNGKDKRTDVIINLRKYGKSLEDFFDFLVFEERQNEETVPLESLLNDLKDKGRYKDK